MDILAELERAQDPSVSSVNQIRIMKLAREEILRLHNLVNTPETDDFIKAVVREAEHQKLRWGQAHDNVKTVWDWFWLIGYLSQKAAAATSRNKRLHHIITTSAALKNWYERERG